MHIIGDFLFFHPSKNEKPLDHARHHFSGGLKAAKSSTTHLAFLDNTPSLCFALSSAISEISTTSDILALTNKNPPDNYRLLPHQQSFASNGTLYSSKKLKEVSGVTQTSSHP
ncbi:MAG: hypothetical protein R3B93_02040 [Bacteroidia bacterium]